MYWYRIEVWTPFKKDMKEQMCDFEMIVGSLKPFLIYVISVQSL